MKNAIFAEISLLLQQVKINYTPDVQRDNLMLQ